MLLEKARDFSISNARMKYHRLERLAQTKKYQQEQTNVSALL